MAYFITLFLYLIISIISTASAANDIVTLNIKATISNNLACTLDCGNCCTGQIATDTSNSSNITIGSSDVILDNYANDHSTHWIKGYYYNSSGSCNMGSCTFFHITSIDNNNESSYEPQTGKLTIPSVIVNDKQYSVILNAPYSIQEAIEIVEQGSDCSKGQQCAEGYTCTTYHGITGAELKSCEIPCINKQFCPKTKTCINIADGPQNVCQ